MSTEQTFYVSLNKRFTEGLLVGAKLLFTFKLWLSLTGNPTALGQTSLCDDSRSFQIAVLCREENVHFWRRTSVKFEKVTAILFIYLFFYVLLGCCWAITTERKSKSACCNPSCVCVRARTRMSQTGLHVLRTEIKTESDRLHSGYTQTTPRSEFKKQKEEEKKE